jgi:deferrochelatase/peroxidase EfeB
MTNEADRSGEPSTSGGGLTRRAALQSATALALGAGAATGVDRLAGGPPSSQLRAVVPFHGRHQAGIATAQQAHLHFASFAFDGTKASDLRDLLVVWSQAAAAMTAGRPVQTRLSSDGPGPADRGEALELGQAALTVTIGLGRSLFEQAGRDRLGLHSRMPAELAPLPRFPGEQLEPRLCGGDLCVQACADDPQVAFHAVRTLVRIASAGGTRLLWNQIGFLPAAGEPAAKQRNLLGFKDGTNNIRSDDHAALNRHVWVARGDEPVWMSGGSYLVARRIRVWFDTWDATSLHEQEHVIGRYKSSGAPLDPIPADAHIRIAAASANSGARILRRGYSFADPVEPGDGQLDAGLFFISYQRSVHRQFVPIQHSLATHDALNMHTAHTGSAVFACPPGPSPGGYVGQTLFG